MNTIASIKNNKISCHPQYDVVLRGETVGRIVRVCVHIPRRNHSDGSNRWDVLVYAQDVECREQVEVEEDSLGIRVGHTCGIDTKLVAFMLHENALGSKDREMLEIIPVALMDLDAEQVAEVRQHLEATWGFVPQEDGTRKQIATFPWPTENKPRW